MATGGSRPTPRRGDGERRGRQQHHRPRARTLRRQQSREQLKRAMRAEGRGRQVPATVAGYRAVLAARGFDAIAEALISRHNQRFARAIEATVSTQMVATPVLASAVPLWVVLSHLGAIRERPPSFSGKTWVDHLAWGVDSISAGVRLQLALQPVGAAIIARSQLERWSSNLEFNGPLTRVGDEGTADWLTRLWSSPGTPRHGRTQPVGAFFADLSELLHGRGRLMSLVWLDVADIADHPGSDHIRLLDTFSDATAVSLSWILHCVRGLASDQSFDLLAKTVAMLPLMRPAESWTPDIKAAIVPLTPTSFRGIEGQLGALETGYLKVLGALTAEKKPEEPPEVWPAFAFGDQRFRALLTARWAFEHERSLFGADFDESGIEDIACESVLAGEMAAMLAIWLRDGGEHQFAADAFATCASGLRSALWLWLEDDDRAMGCLRVVIEQLARVRTWRLKPERAGKLDSSPDATPRDWLERAGWRRLSILGRALGEFAHMTTAANPSVARDALVQLQRDTGSSQAQFTGRTHALSLMIHLVSEECVAWLEGVDADLAAAYRQVTRVDKQRSDAVIEEVMNHAWKHRGMPVR